MTAPAEFDTTVRLYIYQQLVDAQAAPGVDEAAQALKAPRNEVEAAYERLAAGRVIVLTPGTRDIRMANPFSAVPTSFRVETSRGAYWGNCIWDALGIPAALNSDARITTSCPDCGEPLVVAIENATLTPGSEVVHFAIPAARWWDDIIFT